RPALNGSCFRKNSKLSARPKNNICSSTMTSALRWSASAGPSSTGAWPGEPRHGRSHTGTKGGPAALCRGAAACLSQIFPQGLQVLLHQRHVGGARLQICGGYVVAGVEHGSPDPC